MKNPKRRRFLHKAMLAGLALASSPSRAETEGMLRRPIPRSDETLPAVGLGTYRSFATGDGAAAREPVREVLRLFVEYGGALVDSSPMYGSAETVLGDLASSLGVRASLFMATKVWISGREAGIRQMEESFRRMRVERMDLMQIHNLLDWRTHAQTLAEWKQAGRIRYSGVTHYHEGAYDDLERIMKARQFDFVQLNYSIVEREAERSLLPLAQDTGHAVIVNRPFAQAGLFSRVRGKSLPAWAAEFDCHSWAQFFLKYILSHPAVTCAIPATSNPKHLEDNMMAGIGRLPDAATRRKMASFMDAI